MSIYRLSKLVPYITSASNIRNKCIVNNILQTRKIILGVSNWSDNATNIENISLGPNETAKKAAKDRTQFIPVETSIKYLKSDSYKKTYGEGAVWEHYRRNHKGLFPPRKTRITCIRQGVISTGNPCPICRDEYLVLNEHNIELLKQFVSPHTGEVLSYSKTGLCQKRHQQLLVAVERARDYGFLTFDVPFREYDYSAYNKKEQ